MDSQSERIFIGVGGNLEPQIHLPVGLRALGRQVGIVAVSTFFHTAPIGRPEQPHYYNGVVQIETELGPEDLRNRVLRPIETAVGRVRSQDRFSAHPLDLDILLYGDRVLATPEQEIPDPDILDRPFLAAGLLEIDPTLLWPCDNTALALKSDFGARAALERLVPFTAAMRAELLPGGADIRSNSRFDS